jgi:choline dehydrogenase
VHRLVLQDGGRAGTRWAFNSINYLQLNRRIVHESQALKPHAPEEFMPGPQFQSDAELARVAGQIGATISHPVGTCRKGQAGEPAAVVDP